MRCQISTFLILGVPRGRLHGAVDNAVFILCEAGLSGRL